MLNTNYQAYDISPRTTASKLARHLPHDLKMFCGNSPLESPSMASNNP